ncbi:hypothetical protein BSKO_07337 [Bryopsis sp. KO-2023]|nr:hypothetical protein BSKO_07337 [Bryopsis sp. KO-2023]
MRTVAGRISTHAGALADLGDPDGIDEIGNGVTVSNRRCAKCGVVKPASCFYRNKWAPTGLHHYCRPCEAKRQKLYTRTRNTLEKSRRISGRYRYERIPRALRGEPRVGETPSNGYDTDSKEAAWSPEYIPVPRTENVAPSASVCQTRRMSARLNNLAEEHDSKNRGRKRVAERCLVTLRRRSTVVDELSEKRWKTVDEWFAFCCPENPGVDLVETRGAVRRRYNHQSPRVLSVETESTKFTTAVHKVDTSELMFPDEPATCWSDSDDEGEDALNAENERSQQEKNQSDSKSLDQENIGGGEAVEFDRKVVVGSNDGDFEVCQSHVEPESDEELILEEDEVESPVKADVVTSLNGELDFDAEPGEGGLDVVVEFGDMQEVVLLSDQERRTSRKSAGCWPSATPSFQGATSATEQPSGIPEKQ